MGQCYYFSVNLMLSMQYICVQRREVLETNAVPLPLLAYCKHVPANTILQTNVHSLVSFYCPTRLQYSQRDIKPWLVARIQTPLLMSQTSVSPACAHSLQLQPLI